MTKLWSPYQNNIFAHVEDPNAGNAIVVAVAGSGKSTTLVETCNRVRGSHLMLAFNKAIAEELKAKGVNARTFHSLTYGPVTKARGTPGVESNKLRMLCDKYMEKNDSFLYSTFCSRLVGLARNMGVGVLVPNTPEIWWEIVEFHDLELETENSDIHRAVQLAEWLLEASNSSNLVDFDDLLYFAVKDDIRLSKFDFVFVDEAQDTNPIQRAILSKVMLPHSRIIAVGDPAQAIYGFRGADSRSMSLIAEQFNAIELPLTVSYRCSTDIVKHAHKWVEHIEPAPDAPKGEVVNHGTEWKNTIFESTDLVVCRTTKPLVNLAYKLMRDRIPVKIMGRDIGSALASLIKKQKCDNIDDLLTAIEVWAAREVDKALGKRLEAKAAAQQDKADAIICLAETLAEDERTIPHLLEVITNLFTDKPGHALKLATIHKSKGMEADRVFWLNSSQCPARWAKLPWMQEQERNLCYVATTRAISYLGLIEDGSGVAKKGGVAAADLIAQLEKEGAPNGHS